MFCVKCGTKLPEGSGFCHSCGAKAGGVEGSVLVESSSAPLNTDSHTEVIAAADNKGLKYLIVAGCCVYLALFFFPWVKVFGQEWLAMLGLGTKDGFSPFGFIGVFWKLIRQSGITMAIFIVIFFGGMVVAPFKSLWAIGKNILCMVFKTPKDRADLADCCAGPGGFIIGYYVLKWILGKYLEGNAGEDLLLDLVGYAFTNNLVTLTAVPWILLALGGLMWYLTRSYLKSMPVPDEAAES